MTLFKEALTNLIEDYPQGVPDKVTNDELSKHYDISENAMMYARQALELILDKGLI